MDYETADGSHFSLRELWSDEDENTPEFQGTLITAFVDGNAYAGRSPQRMEEMDDMDVIQYLEPVPEENVFPLFPDKFTVAPPFDMSDHYLKAPQFTFEDSEPGRTFVAKCLLNEASVLEQLRKKPHPNIVSYYGCVLKGPRITHLCLKRCYCSLTEYSEIMLSKEQKERILKQVRDGIEHLHSLGLAHNDIHPDNICIASNARDAVIVDFDSCTPIGKALLKGTARTAYDDLPISDPENDFRGLEEIRDFLYQAVRRRSSIFSDGDPQG